MEDHTTTNNSKYLQMVSDLEKQKKLSKTVNLSKLPDKGAKIKSRIEELETALKSLTISSKITESSSRSVLENVNDSESHSDVRKNVSTSKLITSQQDPSDSGFSESKVTLQSNKSLTFSEALASADVISFSELSKKAPEDNSKVTIDVSSPAFKTYRNTVAIPSVKLIEAKPLYENYTKKKPYNTPFSSVCLSSLVDEETVKQLHECLEIFPDDTAEVSPPKYLKTSLMRHQIEALTWLIWREAQVPSGGILADDMGLGKTLTMISLMLKQRETGNFSDYSNEKSADLISKGTLVICLTSIIHQWQEECKNHTKPHALNVLLYHGPKREREVSFMKRHDVVLTTYNTLMSEKKSSEKGKLSGLFQLKWERIILDESHTIKNHASQTAQAVFSLRGFKKWCITGTPFHNDFKDIYSLLKFLKFYPFDDYKKFKKLTDDDTKESLDRRNMLIKSILLRRTKQESDQLGKPLVEMKKKSIIIREIELSEEEKEVYEEINAKVKNIFSEFLQNNSRAVGNNPSLLVLLLRLQQCCCHPTLLSQETEETINDSLDSISSKILSLSINEESSKSSTSDLDCSFSDCKKYDIYNKEVKSSKIKELFKELSKISAESKNSVKSVIVSQWVSMLDLVAYHLDQEKISYHKLVGSTKAEDRRNICDDFNNNADGSKILLLSLKAGGVGLNLIGASHLFLLDLHWNPALEKQACDRIHRVGQKNDVFIHKFVCKETIEERILALQEQKSNLASDVFSGAANVKQRLSIEDFKTLFNVRI